jgi:hypothetical protein
MEAERAVMAQRIAYCAWDTEAIDRHNELSGLLAKARREATRRQNGK